MKTPSLRLRKTKKHLHPGKDGSVPIGIRLGELSSFRRNFIVTARANVIALALPILATPFLTRIFDPSAFALLGVFLATTGIVTAFATLRMDWAMPNARTDVIAASLFVAGVSSLSVVTLLSTLCLAVIVAFPHSFPGTEELDWFIWLAPPIVLAAGMRALMQGWLVKTGELGAVAHSTIVQSTSNVGLSFVTGIAGLVTAGLLVASAVASWAGISILMVKAGERFRRALHRVTIKTVGISLRRHGKETSWSTGVSVLNSFTLSAPTLMFGVLYSQTEVGWFVLMQRMVAGPIGAFSSALGQSFWSHAGKLALEQNMRELSRVYQVVTLRLALASIPVLAVCLSGPWFLGALLGEEEWSGAGSVLAAMAPLFAANLLFSPTNHLVVLHKQHLQFFVDTLRLGLMSAGIAVSYIWELGFVTAVFLSSLGNFVGYLTIYIIQVREHAK